MKRYFHDAAVLARKDVLLELRGRETLPAMVLFVVAGLVVFHFAVPTEDSEAVERRPACGSVILFTAMLALVQAFVAEREQRLMDGLLLAPCDRSAIWLGKSLAVLAFLLLTELVALPAFALFFGGLGWGTVAGVCLANIGIVSVGHAARRDGLGNARPGAPLAPALPPARDSDRRRRGGCERLRRSGPVPRLPGALRRGLCDHLVGFL